MTEFPTGTATQQGRPPRDTVVSADRFLAAIVDSSDDAIIGKTLDGIITSWNLGAERLYGYAANEAIGQHISLIIPLDRPNELPMIMAQLRHGTRIDHFETVRVRKDGTRRDISVSISPIHDDSGHIIGAASIGRDITERRRAERDLRVAEARYRTLVEQLPAVVALGAPDATQSTLYISPTCEALFGYTPEEYLADPSFWVQTMHPDDRERVLAGVTRMNATGESGLVEYRMLARDGRVVWILEDSTLIQDDAGRPLYWQTVQMDVTDRKQAEERELQAEERFRTAFDSAAIGMALIDLEGRFLQVNAALCALLGYTEAELLARTFQDITYPDDLAADLAQVQRLVAGEIGSYQMEKRYLHKSGQVIWGHLSGAVVRDEQGAPRHFIGQLENITERKQAEQALQQSEERFRTAFEYAPVGMDIVDLDGRFLRVNATLCKLTGYTEAELLARGFEDITVPGDLAADHLHLAQLLAGEASSFQLEKRYLRKDGAIVWGRINTALVRDECGAPLHYISQLEDVTERNRAEEARAQLAAIVDAAEDGILSCTLEGTILSWNRGAERLYGYTAEEAIGQSVPMLRPSDLADDIAGDMERVRQGESIERHETVRLARDGRRVDVSLSITPMRDARGAVVAIASISRDISARKAADVALQNALEGMQASAEAKERFLTMMSHELRTPLQSVLGYADLLLSAPDDALNAEQREDLDAIQRGATRMVTLIEQTLDLSRMKAGHLVLERASLDLDSLLRQVGQDVAPQANAKGITLQIDESEIPPIEGDLGRVYQILLNLVANAVKFTNSGEVRLAARATETGVAVAVRDTGIGIAPEALEHIFEEYHQGQGGVDRRYRGTGLGLAIASRLAEGMGGHITVESEVGRGSCFTLHLPGES